MLVMSKKEETIEEQILVAAYNVFIEKGYENSKMQDIADRAGIKRTVLNYYFRSKELLYHNIAKTILRQAMPSMLKVLNSDLEFEIKIEKFVDSYLLLITKNPFMPLFIINEINNLGASFVEKLLEGNLPNIDTFIFQVQQDIKKGKIVNIEPIQVFIHIISLCAFPILAKPMIMLITGKNEAEFQLILEERKTEITRMILKGLLV